MDRTDILPGTLQLLILKTLARAPAHGYAIAQHIKRSSDDALQVEEGSLYPALQRILRSGWATAEWVPREGKRRARVYRLTPAGRQRLAEEMTSFTRTMQAIVRVIEPA